MNDMIGGSLLELVIQQQCAKNKVALNLHTQFRDAIACYGIGITVPTWETRIGKKYKR